MQVLVSYAVMIEGIQRFGNCLLPEGYVPIRWIAEMNRANMDQRKETKVNRTYVLLNSWQVSDYDLKGIMEDGTGYLYLLNCVENKAGAKE